MITASVVWQTPMIDTQGFMYMHTCIKKYYMYGHFELHFSIQLADFKTSRQSGLSAAKNDMRHTSMLFTGTTKSPFSTPHMYLYNYWAELYIF